jgi:hypothetical protein
LAAGGLFAAAWALSGCQSAPTTIARLPGPLWPDQEAGDAPKSITAPVAAKPAAPSYAASTAVEPKSAWTSVRPIVSRADRMNGISRITVHHSAIPSAGLTDRGAIVRQLQGIQREHMHRRGEPFADIGYHYIIDPTGRIWEGRSLSLQGAHVANQNEHNLGVMCMGNFDRQSPTQAQLATLQAFLAEQMSRYRVPVKRVYTHRELGSSSCPGNNLQRFMVSVRSGGALA